MSDHNKNNQFLLQGSILAVASIIVRLIGLAYRIPMNRILGNEGMGAYTNAFDVYNIALIISSYSLPLAVSKLVAYRRVRKEHKNAFRLFLTAMSFAMVSGLIAALIVFFGADFIATELLVSENSALPLKVLAPTIFVFAIMGVFRGFFQGKNTMIPTAVSQVIEQIVNAIVSIVASYFLVLNFSANAQVAAYGAMGGTLGTLLGAMTGLVFLVLVFLLYRPTLKKQIRKDKGHREETYGQLYRVLIATTFPIVLSQVVYNITGTLDASLFGNIMANKEVALFELEVLKDVVTGEQQSLTYTSGYTDILRGIYGNQYRLLTNVPVAIATAMGTAMVTSITVAYSKELYDVIKSRVHTAVKFNMIVAIPSAVGMAVLASPILQLLFNESYRLTANYFLLGSIAIVFYSLSTVSTSVLQGINQLRLPVIHAAISLVIHVILVFGLLQFTPMNSYALIIGNVTFPLVICILNWIAIEKHLDYRQEVFKTFVIPTICAVIMGGIAYISYQGIYMLISNNAVSTFLAIGLAVIVYFVLLILLKGVNEEEIIELPMGRKIVGLCKKLHLIS